MREVEIEFTQEMADEFNETAKKYGLDKYPGYKPSKPGKMKGLFG